MSGKRAAAHHLRMKLAAVSFADDPAAALPRTAFPQVFRRLPKGKAGGQGGIVAEFLEPLSTERVAALHAAVEGRLQGCEAAPTTVERGLHNE